MRLGSAAMWLGTWGTHHKVVRVQEHGNRYTCCCRYEEITGQSIEECSFKALRDDEVHGWLGASPDGLVQGLGNPCCWDALGHT